MKVSCIQTLILTLFFKSEFLSWNRSELAPRTLLVGFSRSDSEGFVYSNIDFDIFFQNGVVTMKSIGIRPRDPLGWIQQVR